MNRKINILIRLFVILSFFAFTWSYLISRSSIGIYWNVTNKIHKFPVFRCCSWWESKGHRPCWNISASSVTSWNYSSLCTPFLPTVKESFPISNLYPKIAIPSSCRICWFNSGTKSCVSPCQLIEPFIWWLTTMCLISSSCGRWSAEEKLA